MDTENNTQMNTYYNKDVITEAVKYSSKFFEGDCTGHDWWHTYRVMKLARFINSKENGDLFIVELSALLHDVDDHKFSKSNNDTPENAISFLNKFNIPSGIMEKIILILSRISFRGANVENKITTIEGMIVQDADRLDAIGAIGIARAFAYGGYKGTPLYIPGEEPIFHNSFEEYKKRKSSTVTHFHEKLLLLKNEMNTKTGSMIAEKRHQFMVNFLNQFVKEWEAEDLL